MKTNPQPYSEQRKVQLTFSDNIESFARILDTAYVKFRKHGAWVDIPEVPGTLTVSVVADPENNKLYNVSGKFRVAFSDPENQATLQEFSSGGVIIKYMSAGNKERVAGSKACPLRLSMSEVDGFDGYECTLTGTQDHPQCFI